MRKGSQATPRGRRKSKRSAISRIQVNQMAKKGYSLLAGRNQAALSPQEIRRVINTFLGLDKNVNARYEPSSRTVFWVRQEESGGQYGEIVFGPDIYPGPSVIDPNSALSLDAAAAHELTHYHRWKDKTHCQRIRWNIWMRRSPVYRQSCATTDILASMMSGS